MSDERCLACGHDHQGGKMHETMLLVKVCRNTPGVLCLCTDDQRAIAALRAEIERTQAEREHYRVGLASALAEIDGLQGAIERLKAERAPNLIGNADSTWRRLARILETHVGPVPWTALFISDRAPTEWHIEHARALLSDDAALSEAVKGLGEDGAEAGP